MIKSVVEPEGHLYTKSNHTVEEEGPLLTEAPAATVTTSAAVAALLHRTAAEVTLETGVLLTGCRTAFLFPLIFVKI